MDAASKVSVAAIIRFTLRTNGQDDLIPQGSYINYGPLRHRKKIIQYATIIN